MIADLRLLILKFSGAERRPSGNQHSSISNLQFP
jgi:hypothetical protein